MGKINRSISIDENIAKRADQVAKEQSRSFSSLVEYIINQYLRSVDLPNSPLIIKDNEYPR